MKADTRGAPRGARDGSCERCPWRKGAIKLYIVDTPGPSQRLFNSVIKPPLPSRRERKAMCATRQGFPTGLETWGLASCLFVLRLAFVLEPIQHEPVKHVTLSCGGISRFFCSVVALSFFFFLMNNHKTTTSF